MQRQREMIVREHGYSVNLLQKLMMEFVWFGLSNPNHYEMMFMINEPELQQYSRTEQAQCLEMFAIVIRQVMADQPGSESGSLHFRGICLCLYMALFPIVFSLNNPTRMHGNWLRSISVLSVLAWIWIPTEQQRPLVKLVNTESCINQSSYRKTKKRDNRVLAFILQHPINVLE